MGGRAWSARRGHCLAGVSDPSGLRLFRWRAQEGQEEAIEAVRDELLEQVVALRARRRGPMFG